MKSKFLLKIVFAVIFLSAVVQLFFSYAGMWINLTSSMPPGIYLEKKGEIHRNDYVISCLPSNAAKLGQERRYVGYGNCHLHTAPVGKKMVARAGDHAQIDKDGIRVNGKLLRNTEPSLFDAQKRNLKHFELKRKLEDNEVLLAVEKKNSFDARYFGPSSVADIRSTVEPLYLF